MNCNTAPYEGSKPYVFISFSPADAAVVYPIIDRLALHGCRVWFDNGSNPGEAGLDVIAAHLRSCALNIAVVSKASVSSHNFRNEMIYQAAKNRPTILLYPGELTLSPVMEAAFSGFEAIKQKDYPAADVFYKTLLQKKGMEDCTESRTVTPADISRWNEQSAAYSEDTSDWEEEPTVGSMLITRWHSEPPAEEPAPAPKPEPEPESKSEPEPESKPEPADEPVQAQADEAAPVSDNDAEEEGTMSYAALRAEQEKKAALLREQEQRRAAELKRNSALEAAVRDKAELESMLSKLRGETSARCAALAAEHEKENAALNEEARIAEEKLAGAKRIVCELEAALEGIQSRLAEKRSSQELSMQELKKELDAKEQSLTEELDKLNAKLSELEAGNQETDTEADDEDEKTVSVSRSVPAAYTVVRLSTGTEFHLRGASESIGRRSTANPNPGVDLSDNPTVSRHHADIMQMNGKFWLKDNEAAGGTEADGTKLARGGTAVLNNGSIIVLSENEKLRFLIDGAPAPEPLKPEPVETLTCLNSGQTRVLDRTELFLDRSHKAEWKDDVLADRQISGKSHARIYLRDGVRYIIDERSTNGTTVNGTELTHGVEVPLKNGDTIRLGGTRFEYLIKT